MRKSNVFVLLMALSMGLMALSVQATMAAPLPSDVLLLVDDADPAAVTFTATTNDSIGTETFNTFNDGLTLASFLTFATPSFLGGPLTPTNLTTAGNVTPVYDMWGNDSADLTVYTYENDSGSSTPETFTPGSQALTGAGTGDLTSVGLFLPPMGTTGDLYSGSEDSYDLTLIGSYEVVPEPSSGMLLFLASVCVPGILRLRGLIRRA